MQLDIFGHDKIEVSQDEIDHVVQRNIAKAAEYLVAFEIGKRGWSCFMAGEALRYDLIADINGIRRVQVKMNIRSRCMTKNGKSGGYEPGYLFGKGDADLRAYAGDADLLAFVAMDRKLVLYATVSQMKRSHLWMLATAMTQEASDLSWNQVMREWRIM